MKASTNLSGDVQVLAAPHPFKTEAIDFALPAGGTLEDILEAVQADAILRRHAHIFVGGHYVPRRFWGRVYPKGGVTVEVRIVPTGGGGKNPLRTILTIAVIAAAAAFGGPLGAALTPALGHGLAALGLALPVALPGAVGSALILIGGMLLVNWLVPIKPPSIESNRDESPSYFLDRIQNTARIYSPVPVIFGRHKVVPPLGASPVTEAMGDTNRLRVLLVWGFGPLLITDIQIDGTPITEYEDYRIQTINGRSTTNTLTFFPDDIHQQDLNITLDEDSGFVTRRSTLDADEISVDVTLPQGLSQYNNKGKRVNNSVSLEIQFREAGTSGSWSTPTYTAKTVDEFLDLWQPSQHDRSKNQGHTPWLSFRSSHSGPV